MAPHKMMCLTRHSFTPSIFREALAAFPISAHTTCEPEHCFSHCYISKNNSSFSIAPLSLQVELLVPGRGRSWRYGPCHNRARSASQTRPASATLPCAPQRAFQPPSRGSHRHLPCPATQLTGLAASRKGARPPARPGSHAPPGPHGRTPTARAMLSYCASRRR